jgi:ABC-type lipoprotein export system ATPase subunit
MPESGSESPRERPPEGHDARGERHPSGWRVRPGRALANHPRLLLADEPTGALHSESGKRALDLLATTREHHGMTVIVVSHDDAVAERADRVVHLVDGQVS